MKIIRIVILLLIVSYIFSCKKEKLPEVALDSVYNITSTTVQVKGSVKSLGTTYIQSYGACWNMMGNPTIMDDCSKDYSDIDPVIVSIAGLIPNTEYYIKIVAGTDLGYAYSNEMTFSTMTQNTFIDQRDGQEYAYIKFDDKIWMAENLNYYTSQGSWYYNNDSATYAKDFGRLYTIEIACSVCPDGWHLPDDFEWKYLEFELGMNESDIDLFNDFRGSNIAGKIMEVGSIGWNYNIYFATNETGFAARGGGIYNMQESEYNFIKNRAFFWTSTKYDEEHYIYRYLRYNSNGIYRSSLGYETQGMSVRCVKD